MCTCVAWHYSAEIMSWTNKHPTGKKAWKTSSDKAANSAAYKINKARRTTRVAAKAPQARARTRPPFQYKYFVIAVTVLTALLVGMYAGLVNQFRSRGREAKPASGAIIVAKPGLGERVPAHIAALELRRDELKRAIAIKRSEGNSAAPDTSPRLEHQTPPGCRTAIDGDSCFQHVDWAMKVGINEPEGSDWYPGLTADSSFEEFQAGLMHKGCPMPCPRAGGSGIPVSEAFPAVTNRQSI